MNNECRRGTIFCANIERMCNIENITEKQLYRYRFRTTIEGLVHAVKHSLIQNDIMQTVSVANL